MESFSFGFTHLFMPLVGAWAAWRLVVEVRGFLRDPFFDRLEMPEDVGSDLYR